jgi:DNA-binding response OmpR family regulator
MRIIRANPSKPGPYGARGLHHGRRHHRPLRVTPSGQRHEAELSLATPSAMRSLRVGHLDCDSGLLRVTAKRLELLGFEHEILQATVSPEQAVAMGLGALVVDVAVLGPACWDWLLRVRRLDQSLGVLVCSGPSSVAERVRGLRLGVDDWLTKPCHPEELIARVESVVCSRAPSEPQSSMRPVIAGELEIRRHEHQAFVARRSLRLTAREFQLLELLASYEGCILEREFIYQRVWGYDMNRGDRSVDVFVRKVRQKLELASPGWGYVHTHFKVGYRFAAERASADESLPERLAA